MIISVITIVVGLYILLYLLLVDRKKKSIINRFDKTKLYYNEHTRVYRVKYLAYRYFGIFPRYKYLRGGTRDSLTKGQILSFASKESAYTTLLCRQKESLDKYMTTHPKFVLIEKNQHGFC